MSGQTPKGAGTFVGGAKLAVKHADEAAGLFALGSKKADEAVGAFCSFDPETEVTTASGDRPIREVDVGETVTARDPDTGEVSERTVSAVSVHTDPQIEHLRIDGETIETTPDHRFLTDHGWVEAQALYPGTKVQRLDGTFGTVEGYSIEVRAVIMWDLTVSDVHTFAVGEGEWVVHNECRPVLSAFGNASGPRAPREGVDIFPDADGMIGPSYGPPHAGASLTGNPAGAGPTGQAHNIAADAPLPPGTAIVPTPTLKDPTHHSFIPTERMRSIDFSNAFLSLPWAPGIKIRR